MRRFRRLLLIATAGALLAAPAARSASADLVLNQVFAAGGNAGAPYANDFVELFNRGGTTVDLGNWSIQYASGSSTSWQATPLVGSLPAGGHYLVQLASTGTVGAPLPAPDATGTSNLAVSGGKVALVHGTAAVTCGGSPGSCSADPAVADLVGYGSATDYEGGAPAPAISNTTAEVRTAGGCADTDANASDFSAAAPAPQNSASAAAPCTGAPVPGTGPSGDAAVDIDIQPVLSIALERPSISFGTAASGDTPAPVSERVTVVSNHAAGYALTVHRSAFRRSDLPLGLSALAASGGQLGSALVGGAMAPIPVTPAGDLLIGTTAAPSAPAGDGWPTSVGFVSPLPVVASGSYTTTVTFTVEIWLNHAGLRPCAPVCAPVVG
jgi:Lamin Tail Domain